MARRSPLDQRHGDRARRGARLALGDEVRAPRRARERRRHRARVGRRVSRIEVARRRTTPTMRGSSPFARSTTSADSRPRVEENPTASRRSTRAQKRIGAAAELDRGAGQPVADAVLPLVPRATHVTIVLRDDDRKTPSGGLRAGDDARARRRGRRVGAVGAGADHAQRVPQGRRASAPPCSPPTRRATSGRASRSWARSIRSTIGVPLWKGDEILGVLQVDNRDAPGDAQRSTTSRSCAVLAANASLAVANARLIKRLVAAEERLKKENTLPQGPRREAARRRPQPEIIGKSAPMTHAPRSSSTRSSTRASPCSSRARPAPARSSSPSALHYRSRRRDKLFVAQNCAAMPENLLESELFGHKKGSFTGAHRRQEGALRDRRRRHALPRRGHRDAALAAVEAAARAAGGRGSRRSARRSRKHVNVRIVAATQPQPRERGRRGALPRGPLLPPQGVPAPRPAAARAPRRHPAPRGGISSSATPARSASRSAGFTQQAMELLDGYDWPGNVRELQNEVQRLVIQRRRRRLRHQGPALAAHAPGRGGHRARRARPRARCAR